MNHIFFVFLLLFNILSASNNSMLKSAQEAYNRNDFKQALSLYEKIDNKTAQTWFYMGNCYYQLNDDIQALLSWQRAYHYGTGFLVYQSAANYEFVAKKLGIYVPTGLNIIKKTVHAIPLFLMQILFFCVFSVFLLLSYRLYYQKKYGILTSLTLLLFMISGALKISYTKQHPAALVMPEQVTVYAGPSLEYHELFVVPAGLPVLVCKDQKEWLKITYGKQHGWLQKKQVTLI